MTFDNLLNMSVTDELLRLGGRQFIGAVAVSIPPSPWAEDGSFVVASGPPFPCGACPS